MSKRALKSYLSDLSKSELEEQIVELYDRLKEVKSFYDFVFNPKEDKMLNTAKFAISKEYFPVSSRRPKKRRSVAQNQIKNFIKLGVDPALISDLMLYNLEIALAFTAENEMNQASFYKSMLKSFTEALEFIDAAGLESLFNQRLNQILEKVIQQNWENKFAFERLMDKRF
jgi:hypothetical protein